MDAYNNTQNKDGRFNVFADLNGLRYSNNPNTTIPETLISNAAYSSLKPDLVIVKSRFDGTYDVHIMELTVPFETNFNAAHKRKMMKYRNLTNHINSRKGIQCQLSCIEIGSRGILSKENTKRLRELVTIISPTNNSQVKRLKFQVETIAIQASHRIFQQRRNNDWYDPPIIQVAHYESLYKQPT